MCMENPQAPSPGQSMGETLGAEVAYAPQVFAMNQEYAPQYAQLAQSNLDQFLNGNNGNGFLSEYTNSIMPQLVGAQSNANTATRTANISDAMNLSGAYNTATRAANPGAAGLLDQLSATAQQQLGYGTQLTQPEQFQLNQSVRAGQAARGMGQGPSDVFQESMADTNMGQNLLQQREGAAGGAANELQGFYGNPVGAISGMSSGAGMSSSGLAGLASGAGSEALGLTSGQFNPQSSMALSNQNQLWEQSQAGAAGNNFATTAQGNSMSSY